MTTLEPVSDDDLNGEILADLQKSRESAEAFLVDALRFQAASQYALEDLKTRSFLRRFVGKFTGANNRLRDISQEHINASLRSTHRYVECLVRNTQFLSDSLIVTHRFVSHLKMEQDLLKDRVVTLFKKTHERLSCVEAKIEEHTEEIEKWGIVVAELTNQVKILYWSEGLRSAFGSKRDSPVLVKLFAIAQGFIESKPRFWTNKDLDIFRSRLLDYCGKEVGITDFFEDIANLSESEVDVLRNGLSQLFQHFNSGALDRPFYLFSGVTWPVALLWILICDRENLLRAMEVREGCSKGSILRERIESVYGFPALFSADVLDLGDFGVELLAGLRPLTDPRVVKERMLDLVDDARMEFCEALNRGALLARERGRVSTRDYFSCEDYPKWCDEVIGVQAQLMQTARNEVTLHIQHFVREGTSQWRIVLCFKGPYQSLKDYIVSQAEAEGIGAIGLEGEEGFEILCEIKPEWHRWDGQRQELAQKALKTYQFFAACPLPPA